MFFFDRKEAETVAAAYLNSHDVIRSLDIHPVNTVAYKCGERTAFYSELDNGCYYMKNFMTYPVQNVTSIQTVTTTQIPQEIFHA